MQLMKWISLMLALYLLLSATALSEEVLTPDFEAQVAPAEGIDETTGLSLEGIDGEPTAFDAVPEPDCAVAAPAAPAEGANASALAAGVAAYVATAWDGVPVYVREADWDVTALLGANDVALATGVVGTRAAIAFNAGGALLNGFVELNDILFLDDARVAAYLDAAAASGAVVLYAGDINFPLMPAANAVWGEALAVMANYSDISNDTVYTMNGVQVCASMVPDPGSGNCWRYAQGIYELVWGCRFSENFKGNASTGYNLLSELNDAQRTLTPAHLKAFILRTTPGATIRIGGCTSQCSSFENDGLGCGHTGHSLIVVDHNEEGVVTMDSHSNSQHTRFYSWKGFCNAWSSFPYVKYIKWPGASSIPAGEIPEDGSAEIPVTGIALSQTELTLDVGASATLTTIVTPENATDRSVLWASTDESVATVANGVVTGVKAGVAGIWVKSVSGDFNANCTVTVKNPIPVQALNSKGSNGTVVLGLGEQLQLSADFATANGWSVSSVESSKSKYATVSNTGLVTGVSVGKTKITVRTSNGKKATLKVMVVDPYEPAAIAITQGKTVTLAVGETLQLNAVLAPSTARSTLGWASSKEKVATVDTQGLVTARSVGKAKIGVVTQNKKKTSITVEVVNPNAVSRIALNKSGTVKLKAGQTLKLECAVLPAGVSTTFTWKSSNESVATVDANGNVTTHKAGKCYIGVMTADGKLAKVKLKVSN